jgi:signal transduction histidine kinase
MTEHARVSEAQPEASGLDRAEFLRTEFLDRIAHELRGPAGVTLGALDEIELALGDAAEQSRPFLAMARRGAYKVLRTADRLTRTALLEGGVQFHLVATDLRQLVRQAGVDAFRLEERAKVQLDVVLPEEPITISMDAGWVQSAVTELISHAMHRAKSLVSVSITKDHALVITNDGANDTASIHTQRFESRADRRDAGLALPLAREVAHAHGGSFIIESSAAGMLVKLSFGATP